MPASSRPCSRTRPAGPTNGRPALSSWSPGCSPTSIRSASSAPSPKTVWVPFSHRWQALQPAASPRSSSRFGAPTHARYPGFGSVTPPWAPASGGRRAGRRRDREGEGARAPCSSPGGHGKLGAPAGSAGSWGNAGRSGRAGTVIVGPGVGAAEDPPASGAAVGPSVAGAPSTGAFASAGGVAAGIDVPLTAAVLVEASGADPPRVTATTIPTPSSRTARAATIDRRCDVIHQLSTSGAVELSGISPAESSPDERRLPSCENGKYGSRGRASTGDSWPADRGTRDDLRRGPVRLARRGRGGAGCRRPHRSRQPPPPPLRPGPDGRLAARGRRRLPLGARPRRMALGPSRFTPCRPAGQGVSRLRRPHGDTGVRGRRRQAPGGNGQAAGRRRRPPDRGHVLGEPVVEVPPAPPVRLRRPGPRCGGGTPRPRRPADRPRTD